MGGKRTSWPAIGLIAGLVFAALPAAAGGAVDEALAADACALLTDREVSEVQGAGVLDRIASTQQSATLTVRQCVYRSEDFTHSVSLTLTVPVDGGGGAREYWRSRFHPAGGHTGKEDPPRPVPDLGEEAFWTGDARVGALYVLVDDGFLCISVGGVRDQQDRERRTIALATQALARTPSGSAKEARFR